MIFRYGIMKMPNNNKYCPVGSEDISVYMAMHKIRSNKKGFVMTPRDAGRTIQCDVEQFATTLASKGFEELHVIEKSYSRIGMENSWLRAVRAAGVKVFILKEEITDGEDYTHFMQEYSKLCARDSSFMPSRQNIITAIQSAEYDLDIHRRAIEETKEKLFAKEGTEVNPAHVKAVASLPWVENFEMIENALKVNVKEMPIIHCPHIGSYFSANVIRRYATLYEIGKLQYLGYRFIAIPQTYTVQQTTYSLNSTAACSFEYIAQFLYIATYFGGTIPHIGPRGSCYGEFSSNIAQSQKLGFDMFMYGMQTYIQSVNITDPAGARVVMLPMKKEGSDIVRWPAVDWLMRVNGMSMKKMDRTLEGYDKILEKIISKMGAAFSGRVTDIRSCMSDNIMSAENDDCRKNYIKLLEKREPELVEQLRKENIIWVKR